MVSLSSRIFAIAALLLLADSSDTRTEEPVTVKPHVFSLNKAVTEIGAVRVQGTSLVIEPDARVRFGYGEAYGLRNGVLRVVFSPPAMNKSLIPVLAQRPECLCALKVHIGRVVTELSDRGVRVFLQDQRHSHTDTVYAEKLMDMTPDGTRKSLDISIEDRIARIMVDNDTLLSCAADSFDFSLLHLAAFGHVFTVHELSLQPVIRPVIAADPRTPSILLDATYYPSRFNSRGGLMNHHFITWKGGRASMQALIETSAPDSIVHDALAAMGVRPGNNLTIDSWNKRRSAASPEPDKKAEGDPVEISILFGGREFSAGEVLADLHGNPFDFRFAGNRAFIPVWKSGCVACLQSCPGSKIANRTYTMRDLEQKKVSFKPATGLPFRDGDPVRVRIKPVRP